MPFPHERLDAYHVAKELAVGVERLAASLPRGHANVRDQIRRAAHATMLNIAEGANRWSPRDKAARFATARGECGECDAALAFLLDLGLGAGSDVHSLRHRADRVGAMLTGLIRKQRRREEDEPSG